MTPKRVLVVEDDASIRELLVLVLETEGYAVAQAEEGGAALATASASPPDLILLDLKMAGMNGIEFARRYREMSPPHAPIVVITAARTEEEATEVKAAAFLSKPFELDDLLGVVRTCLAAGASPG